MKLKYKLIENFKHNHRSPAYIIAWVGAIVGICALLFVALYKSLPSFSNQRLYAEPLYSLLLDFASQFTIQTNFLLIIFYLLWIFGYKLKIFRTNTFLVACTSYIFLVFVVSWFVMAPIFIIQATVITSVVQIIDHIVVHLVTPSIFITFFCFAASYKKAYISNKTLNFWSTWACIIIYPLIYFVFLISINFVPLPDHIFNYQVNLPDGDHNYMSIYNILSNYNPKCYVPIWDGAHWTITPPKINISIQKGQLWRLVIVPIILIIYSMCVCAFAYFANYRSGVYCLFKKYNRKLIY